MRFKFFFQVFPTQGRAEENPLLLIALKSFWCVVPQAGTWGWAETAEVHEHQEPGKNSTWEQG